MSNYTRESIKGEHTVTQSAPLSHTHLQGPKGEEFKQGGQHRKWQLKVCHDVKWRTSGTRPAVWGGDWAWEESMEVV